MEEIFKITHQLSGKEIPGRILTWMRRMGKENVPVTINDQDAATVISAIVGNQIVRTETVSSVLSAQLLNLGAIAVVGGMNVRRSVNKLTIIVLGVTTRYVVFGFDSCWYTLPLNKVGEHMGEKIHSHMLNQARKEILPIPDLQTALTSINCGWLTSLEHTVEVKRDSKV